MRYLFLLLILSTFTQGAITQSWLTPWKSRQSINITNYNLQPATDYQVLITVPYQECMDSSFVDLRFTNEASTVVYDHWIRQFEKGVKASVYVKVDHLPAYMNVNIWCYYDNFAANPVSDPNSTMIYYDDFDIDSGWNDIGNPSTSIITLSDGTTVLSKDSNCMSDGTWKSLGQEIENFKLIARDFRPRGTAADCNLHEYGVEDANFKGLNFIRDGYNTDNNGEIGIENRDGPMVFAVTTENASQPSGQWYQTEVSYCHICLFNTNAVLFNDDMQLLESVYHSDYAMYMFDRFTLRGGSPYMLDYIAIAQKLCIEPVIAFGVVEDCPTSELISFTADHCEDGEGEIVFKVKGGLPPYDIRWFLMTDSIGQLTAGANDTIAIDSLQKGTYTIQVTDSAGCEN